MNSVTHREIPFNYTSADDRQAVIQLLGEEAWAKLEQLRARRVTGRSARLLMRFFGEILVHRRNAYLLDELVVDAARRRLLYARLQSDLDLVERNSAGEELVLAVIQACRTALEAFRRDIDGAPGERARIRAELAPVVGAENVCFDPFTLVSHATDATDWRQHLPVAVVTPSEESQVAPLLATIGRLGLHAVPRGAGTGLTGGAVPLHPKCVVINTEKLNRIRGIERREFRLPGGRFTFAHVMSLEAGVVTDHAIEHAAERGLVFATDPTSAWACTIGGNIAENAGGKTAVLWGTCIDNVLAWTIATPTGAAWTVRREGHPLRKILPDDVVRWVVTGADGAVVRTVELRGDEIRKRGLWKDITNKALGGLPGMQKEGTDGVVTSAEFVLYPKYAAARTLCLEFFGPDMDEASRVILELARAFPNEGREVLQALEHFDDQYVQAIRYEVKAPRTETPKAVLLVDVVGHSEDEAERGLARIRDLLAHHPNTHLTPARDAAEAKRFWADRKKLGAIAKRTNAFKLNEDVVLPLDALAEFARWIDAVNVEEEHHNQAVAIDGAEAFLASLPPPAEDAGARLGGHIERARQRCAAARAALAGDDDAGHRSHATLHALVHDLREMLRRTYPEVLDGLLAAVEEVRSRRIVLATHMHAGDGNVHVNIPVMSNDRAMMRRAEEIVDRVMEKVAALGGVCSGEHGIGVTKIKYLDDARIAELSAWRAEVDPRGVMNPGKLRDRDVLQRVFTPSFNLLELEARILQHGQLEELATRIASCIRCGKCKGDCCVHYPARGMFFHPRNKNLAIGALVEALLYDAQRERSAGFELLRHLEELADHCTLCHKCAKPCPVSIDTGEVSVLERRILTSRGCKRTAPATAATLRYLESTSPALNAAFRAGAVRLGGALQRALSRALAPQIRQASGKVADLLRSPIPPVDPDTLRDVLPPCQPDQALLFEPEGEARSTVFYFPGCGSERLHSSVSMAALHVLLEAGTRVVLPPPFLCCGYPHHANAKEEAHGRTVLRDTIVFSQIREMFRYLDFDAVIVTCGTCREALGAMEAGKIFGCDVVDVARFALSRGARVEHGGEWLYHAPCHDSLDGKAPEVLEKLAGMKLERVPHCCSEAGTLALSRPDISDAMLHRKRDAIAEAMGGAGERVILTNCPSCMQGLGRQAPLGVTARHIAVEIARAASGRHWMDAFLEHAKRATAIRF